MKTKRTTHNPLTKDDLKQVQASIEKIGEKVDKVDKELYITQKIFRLETVSNRYALEQRLDKVMSEFRNDNFKKLDEIMKELEILREDKELSIHQSEEIGKKINDLEKRFAKLEKTQRPV